MEATIPDIATPAAPIAGIAAMVRELLHEPTLLKGPGWNENFADAAVSGAIDALARRPGATRRDVTTLNNEAWQDIRNRPVGPHKERFDVAGRQISNPTVALSELLMQLVDLRDAAAALERYRDTADQTLARMRLLRREGGAS